MGHGATVVPVLTMLLYIIMRSRYSIYRVWYFIIRVLYGTIILALLASPSTTPRFCAFVLLCGGARCVARGGRACVVGGHGPKGGLKGRPSKKRSKPRGAGNRPKMRRSKNTPKPKNAPRAPVISYNFPSSGTPVGKTFLLLPPGSEQPLVSYYFF